MAGIKYKSWGTAIDSGATQQIQNACRLPVSVAAALMPDAHIGYGLPIGGVLATDNAVIPYAVGVDIACRVKLSVLDVQPERLFQSRDALKKSLEKNTAFGIGAHWKTPKIHDVMDRDWGVTKVTSSLKDLAWKQLGTSGSGNHFVEFGEFELKSSFRGVPEGRYTALLSHSGSRGAGSKIADYYSKLAMSKRSELPKELKHLSWLDMRSAEGQEYWEAMELMGHYASANHEIIHREILTDLGISPLDFIFLLFSC